MKIRTDFVTNSSSSSFVISIAIETIEGKTISYETVGCEQEGTEVELYASPKQLGTAESVEALVELLQEKGSGNGFWDPEPEFPEDFFDDEEFDDEFDAEDMFGEGPSGMTAEQFFGELSELESMDEIKSITVTGYETGWANVDLHQTYTYDKTTGRYFGVEKGNPNPNGRAGGLYFSDEKECEIK